MSDAPDWQRTVILNSSPSSSVPGPDSPDWQRTVILNSSPSSSVPGPDSPDWQLTAQVVPSIKKDAPDWQVLVVGPGGTPIGPSGPTSPVTGYVAWYDASQITGVADGALLETWPDLSGNGYDLVQANSVYQPNYYKTTTADLIGGKPVVYFAGGEQYIVCPGLVLTQPFTVFAVARSLTTYEDNAYNPVLFGGNTASDSIFLFLAYGVNCLDMQASGVDSGYIGQDVCSNVWTMVFAGIASILRKNATSLNRQLLGWPGIQGMTGLVVGNIPVPTGVNGWDGPIGEIVIYQGALTLAQVQANEHYLRAKWLT